jgi:hypothetical protein
MAVLPASPASAGTSAGVSSSAVAVDGAASNLADQTWLRWSQGGRVFAEGTLANGFDRVVWQTPLKEGAYTIRLDFYPGPPSGHSYDISSPWTQSITIITKANLSGRAVDPFARADRFQSLFVFDGDLADTGTRLQVSRPSVVGNPRLEAYPGGFGYGLGPDAGIRATQLGFDAGAHNGKFSVLLRAAIESGTGAIFALHQPGAQAWLRLVLDDSGLWMEISGTGPAKRTRIGAALEKGTHDIMMSFRQKEGSYVLIMTIDAGRRRYVDIGAFEPVFDELTVGGNGSVSAIYDAIGLTYDDTLGAPALFASSVYRAYGDSVVAVEGFEAAPGADFTVRGTATRGFLSSALDQGSAVAFAAVVGLGKPISIETMSRGGALRLQIETRDGTVLFSVTRDGGVVDAAGKKLGEIKEDAGSLSVTIRTADAGLELAGSDGQRVGVAVAAPKSVRPVFVADSALNLDSVVVRQTGK